MNPPRLRILPDKSIGFNVLLKRWYGWQVVSWAISYENADIQREALRKELSL